MSSPDHNEPNRPKGRKKIAIEKIDNETNRQVTFSKRRAGLFKKASELCTLTGAEASVVVFSPGDKAYSFGHPDVNTVANKFLGSDTDPPANPIRNPNNEYLTQVESQIQVEKKRKEELNKERKALEKEKWVPSRANIEGLNYEQLENLKGAIMDFGNKLEAHATRTTRPNMTMNWNGSQIGAPSFDAAVIPYGGDDQADMSNNHPNDDHH